MKRGWKLLLSALALYLLLLVALVAAEGRSPNGSIGASRKFRFIAGCETGSDIA